MKFSLLSLLLAVSAVADDAVKALRAAAEKGEANAQFQLAVHYIRGTGG